MDENHQNEVGSKLMATKDKVSVPCREKGIPEHKGTRKRMNTLATLFKTWTIPIGTVIAIATFLWGVISFTLQQQAAQSQALDQQRQTTLQTYLDDMTKLLSEGKLLESQPGNAVRQIARAKTLVTLRQLDPERKGAVIQFLSEAELIVGKGVTGHEPIMSLRNADLRNADLRGAHLSRRGLFAIVLAGADLRGADLSGANLSGTDLSGADLKGADLRRANLSSADLRGTDLRWATLDNTTMQGARYNTKEILVKDSQGKILQTIPPTQWPQGFDPKAAGAVLDNPIGSHWSP